MPEPANPDDYRDEVITRIARPRRHRARRRDHADPREREGDLRRHPRRCLDIVEAVNSPALALTWDNANFVQCGVRPFTEAYPLLAPHVDYLQVKDALAADGTVVPAGEGDGEFRETMRAFAAAGFDGFVSLEPHLRVRPFPRRLLRARELGVRIPGLHRPPRGGRHRLLMTTGHAVVGIGDISALHLDAIRANPAHRAGGRLRPRRRRRPRRAGRAFGVPFFTDHRELLRAVCAAGGAHHHPARPARPGRPRRAGRRRARADGEADRAVRREPAGGSSSGGGLHPQGGGRAPEPLQPDAVAIRDVLDVRRSSDRSLGGRAAVWWFRPTGVLRGLPVARQVGDRRWRRADQPGHPHPRPAAVVPRRPDRGPAASPRRCRWPASIEVEDTATIVIDHDSGVPLDALRDQRPPLQCHVELEITGRDGSGPARRR